MLISLDQLTPTIIQVIDNSNVTSCGHEVGTTQRSNVIRASYKTSRPYLTVLQQYRTMTVTTFRLQNADLVGLIASCQNDSETNCLNLHQVSHLRILLPLLP
jgi:hypothetical protein